MVATEQRMQNQESFMKNQDATVKNLEVQLGQLANIASRKVQGTIPSATEKNPREHVKAVTLKSWKELEEGVKTSDDPYKLEDSVIHNVQVEEATSEVPTNDLSKFKAKRVKKSDPAPSKNSPPLPYVQRLKQEEQDKKFAKFIKQLNNCTLIFLLLMP